MDEQEHRAESGKAVEEQQNLLQEQGLNLESQGLNVESQTEPLLMQEQEQEKEKEQEKAQGLYQFKGRPAKKQKNDKKRLKGWMIWLLIVIAFSVLAAILALSGLFDDAESTEIAETPDAPYVGVLYIEGTIAASNMDSWGVPYGYQHQFTLDSIDEMMEDPENRGILLFVNSPGGGVYESDELYVKLKEYQEETGNPLFSYMGSMAASGGYYISAPADQIYANRNCWTGSIGVTIGTLYDVTGLLDNYGIKTVTITAGRNKAMGSMFDPMTEEQLAIFQALVDEAYDQFTGIVAEERGLDLETVKTIADGRIYTAAQALDLALVDQVCTYDEAVADMKASYGLEDCEFYDMVYQDDSFFGTLFAEIPKPVLPSSDAQAVLSLVQDDASFPISYVCETLDQ